MSMEKRIIFPAIMFVTAGASFAFGTWQYLYAQRVQTASAARTAYIIRTIDRSDLATAKKKQDLYVSIFRGLPPSATLFGIDVSGSFASQGTGDNCTSDGQRAVCRALKADAADGVTTANVCGACNPKQ